MALCRGKAADCVVEGVNSWSGTSAVSQCNADGATKFTIERGTKKAFVGPLDRMRRGGEGEACVETNNDVTL